MTSPTFMAQTLHLNLSSFAEHPMDQLAFVSILSVPENHLRP
jgi:hypothetical protein